MRRKTILDVQKEFVLNILSKRHVPNVIPRKHFLERFVSRRIDPRKMMRALNKLADNLCQIVFSCEIGVVPAVKYEDLVIKLDYYDRTLYLQTCYETTNNF